MQQIDLTKPSAAMQAYLESCLLSGQSDRQVADDSIVPATERNAGCVYFTLGDESIHYHFRKPDENGVREWCIVTKDD